jgi:hypothetical protein
MDLLAHLANLQSVADVIRNGSSLSQSQTAEAKGINLDVPPQVDSSSGTLMSDKPRGKQGSMKEALTLFQKDGIKEPLPPVLQRYKDKQDGKEEESKLSASGASKDIGQCVLGMTFCVNRRAEISRLADNSKLSDTYKEVRDIQLFKKFQRENDSGDPPYYCVTADILRTLHTFKEEYVTKDKERRMSVEFDLHVEEVVAEAKE